VPEIADYEVRRELLRVNATASLTRLDLLGMALGYAPLTTAVMRRAAQFWAEARSRGRPTADAAALDGDMILCAQASLVAETGDEIIVATANVTHLSLFADAALWHEIH
jgi:hypothetical protein